MYRFLHVDVQVWSQRDNTRGKDQSTPSEGAFKVEFEGFPSGWQQLVPFTIWKKISDAVSRSVAVYSDI